MFFFTLYLILSYTIVVLKHNNNNYESSVSEPIADRETIKLKWIIRNYRRKKLCSARLERVNHQENDMIRHGQ